MIVLVQFSFNRYLCIKGWKCNEIWLSLNLEGNLLKFHKITVLISLIVRIYSLEFA